MRKKFFIIISLMLAGVSLIYSQSPEWVTLADMPQSRFGHCSVIYQDRVWIIGGRTQLSSSISKIDCYNLKTEEWEPDASELQNARSNATAAVYDDKIFVIGGHDDRKILNAVEFYDPNEKKWQEVAPLLQPREGANAIVFKDTLFVIGGRSDSGIFSKILDDVEFWDGTGWQEHKTWHLKYARVFMQSVVVDSFIYILGGRFIDGQYDFVERIGQSGEAESRRSFSIPRFYFSAVGVENLIYVLGGVRQGDFEALTDTIEYYSTEHDFWYALDLGMTSPRAGLSAVSYKDNIYVFGGMDIDLKVWNTAEVLKGIPTGMPTGVKKNDAILNPDEYRLLKNYPNPFNSTTTISFELAGNDRQIQLIIFNLRGEQVRAFVLNSFGPGFHQVEWDGRDDAGRIVESGIYLVQLRSNRQYGKILKLSFIK